MNICITPNSINLFAAYFKKEIPIFYDGNVTAKEMMTMLFNKALSDFEPQLDFSKEKIREIVLQHLTIAPEMLYAHMNAPMTKKNENLFLNIKALRDGIIEASVDEKVDFPNIINQLGKMVGGVNKLPPVVNIHEGFDAMSSEFNKTYNLNLDLSEIPSTVEEKRISQFRQSVQLSILNSPSDLKLRAFKSQDVLSKTDVVSEYARIKDNDVVLLFTDAKGNIVKFNEAGNVSETGSSPVMKIKTEQHHFQRQTELLPAIYAENNGVPIEEATRIIQTKIDNYLKSIARIAQRIEDGKTILLDIDYKNSNHGVMTYNLNERNQLKSIANLAKLNFSVGKKDKAYWLQMNAEGSNKPIRIHSKLLSEISNEQFEALYELIVNLKPKVTTTKENEDGKLWDVVKRNDLLTSLVQRSKEKVFTEFFTPEGGKKSLPHVYIQNVLFEIKEENFSDIKEALRSFVYTKTGVPYTAKGDISDVKIFDSLEQTTASEQLYYNNGQVYISKSPVINFGLKPSSTLDSQMHVITGIEDGVIKTKLTTVLENAIEVGSTVYVLNNQNELKASDPYISFTEQVEDVVVDTTDFESFKDSIDKNDLFQSLSSQNRESISEAQEQRADAWMKTNPLLRVLKVNFSDEIHEFGPNFLAEFVGNSINMYLGSSKTDLYHESFHAYSIGILTAVERNAMYAELKNKPGYFDVTVKGVEKRLAFANANELELEEYLAEEFRKFAMSKGKYSNKLSARVLQFFEKISNLLKGLFGNMRLSDAIALNRVQGVTNAMFNNLYEGNIDVSKFSSRDSHAVYQSAELQKELNFSLEETHLVMDSMQALFTEFVTEGVNAMDNSDEKSKDGILAMMQLSGINPIQNKAAYDKAQKVVAAFKNSYADKYNGYGIFRIQNNPKLTKFGLQFVKQRLQQQVAIHELTLEEEPNNLSAKFAVDTLNKAIKNFGNLDEIDTILTKQESYGNMASLFINEYSYVNTEKDKYEDDERVIFERTGAEFSISELVDDQTKQLLSTISSYSKNGKGVLEVNALGFAKLAPFKTMLAKTAKLLTNTLDRDDMYQKLLAASIDDFQIKELVSKLGNPGSPSSTFEEQNQWLAFWQSLNKADVLLREQIIEKTVTYTNEEKDENFVESRTTSHSGRTAASETFIKNDWNDNFTSLLEVIGERKEQGENKFSPYTLNLASFFKNKNHSKFLNEVHESVNGGSSISKSAYLKLPKANKAQFLPTATLRAYAEPVEFLKLFGINISDDPIVKQILKEGSDDLKIKPSDYSYFVDFLIKKQDAINGVGIRSLSDLAKDFYHYEDGVRIDEIGKAGFINSLIKLHSMYSSDSTSFMSMTAYGEKASEKVLNSSLTVEVQALNKANHYDELIAMQGMSKFNYLENPSVAGSKWFVDMFQLDHFNPTVRGKRNPGIKISVENLSGSKLIHTVKRVDEEGRLIDMTSEDKGISSIGSDEKTKFLSDVLLTLDGAQEIPRTEAKSSSMTVLANQMRNNSIVGGKTKELIVNAQDIDVIFTDGYAGSILSNEMIGHLEAELIRMVRLEKLEQEILIDPENFAIDFKYFERGKSFFLFDDILDVDTKNDLLKLARSLSIDELQSFSIRKQLSPGLKKNIESNLKSYFSKKAETLNKLKSDTVFPDELIEKYKSTTVEDESISDTKRRIFRAHIVNNFIQNTNYTSLFLGDLALYNIEGGDFHKRNAGMISTGKIFASDESFKNFVNNNVQFNNFGYAKQLGIERDYQYTGDLKTAILDESKVPSSYLEELEKKLGKETAGTYNNMEEADGQGWITFDTYRLLNISCGEWSAGQEALYKKIVKGETIEQTDMSSTFPVKKFQYYGPLSTTDKFKSMNLGLTAFHKYSLAPLIPNEIKGTKLEGLHKSMMEQGIDYATMQSGSKLSTLSRVAVETNADGKKVIVKKPDTFYKKDRSIDADLKFVPNIISVKHLKNQVFIDEGYKENVVLPTQMKKMILHGIADNGVPMDYLKDDANRISKWNAIKTDKERVAASKNYGWYKEYTDILSAYRDHVKEDLLENIDYQYNPATGTYEGDSTKLADYIKREMIKNDYLPHEVSFLTDASGRLVEDLSYSLSSQKIEEILVTLIDSSLRKIKVKGEALVQVSGAMYESSDMEADANGTNGLKFYESRDEDGSLTFAMEVKISLQGDFKKLLYADHPDGKSIRVLDKKGVMDYDASLKRLNESIKDPEWNAKHKDMLNFPGTRIPTQGPNALDSVTVAEFLPEYSGAKVILPSEIVAKSGADYDIDKMFFLYPSISIINSKPELNNYYGRDTGAYDRYAAEYTDFYESNISPLQERLSAVYDESEKLFKDQTVAFEKAELYQPALDLLYPERKKYNEQLKELKSTGTYLGTKLGKAAANEYKELIETEISKINAQLDSINTLRDGIFLQYVGTLSTELSAKFENFKKQKASLKEQIITQKEIGAELERKKVGHSVKGLENKLVDLFNRKILAKDNFVDLVTPNTTRDVLPIANALETKITTGKYNKLEKIHSEKSNSISPTTTMDYLYNLQKHQENSVGMESLGIAAVVSTFFAMFSTFDSRLNTAKAEDLAKFNDDIRIYNDPKSNGALKANALERINKFKAYTLKLNHNEIGGRISVGSRYAKDGKLTADIISQLINGYVDVGKNAWVFNIQGNKENTPNLLFMVMAGVPIDDAIYISSNPLTIRYNTIKKELSGTYSKLNENNPIGKSLSPDAIREEALDILKKEDEKELFDAGYEKHSFFGINNVASNNSIFETNFLEGRIGSSTVNKDDIEIFAQYVALEELSADVTKFSQVSKYDTTKVSNITDAEKNIADVSKLKSVHSAVPVEWWTKFEKSPIGIYNNTSLVIDMFKNFFKIKNNPVVNRLALSLNGGNKKGILPIVLRNAFKNDLMWFLYQNSVYRTDTYTSASRVGESNATFDLVKEAESATQPTAPAASVNTYEEIPEELKNIVYKSGQEKEDYEIALVAGVPKFIVTGTVPIKLSRGFKVFYSDYAGGQGLYKRSGKKVTIPGFEDIELVMEQETNNVFELSTGLGMPNTKLTKQKEILAELETLFKKQDVRGIIEKSPKINANDANVIIEQYKKSQPSVSVKPANKLTTAYKIDRSNGKVYYNLGAVKNEILQDGHVSHLFDSINSPVEYVKYKVELELLKDEIQNEYGRFDALTDLSEIEIERKNLELEGATEKELDAVDAKMKPIQDKLDAIDAQIREKFYYYSYKKEKFGNELPMDDLLKLEALYRTKTPGMLFDKEVGLVGIFKAMKAKHADAFSEFSLIQDMKFDTENKSEGTRKSNFYLPEKADPILTKVYLENLTKLQNFPDPAVKEFFSKNAFEHMIFMQTGMNTASKYYLGKLITTNNVKNVIDSTFSSAGLTQSLNEIAKKNEKEKKISKAVGGVIGKFYNAFNNMAVSVYKLRNRGYNYVQPETMSLSIEQEHLNSVQTYNNITLVENILAVDPSEMTPFDMSEIFDEKDTAAKIKEKIIALSGEKLAMPMQILDVPNKNIAVSSWNKLLLEYFGFNNYGDHPVLVAKAINAVAGGLSIAESKNRKDNHWVKDESMANNSTKAIATPSESNPNYVARSSTRNYIDVINQTNKKAFDNKYKSTDSVWIFGAGLFKSAYEGLTDLKGYTDIVTADFKKNYEPKITKAIEAGVKTFNVGSANGIDEMALKFLEEKGYTKVVRYSPLGKYYEVVKSLEGVSSPMYDVTLGIKSGRKIGIDNYIYHITGLNLFKGMSEKDISEKGFKMVDAESKKYFAENPTYKNGFSIALSDFERAAINIGSSVTDSFIEQYLMQVEIPYAKKHIASITQVNTQKVYEPKISSTTLKIMKVADLREAHNKGEILYTMRVSQAQAASAQFGFKGLDENKHFGNPFTGSNVEGQLKMKNVDEASMAYEEWLDGQDLFEDKFGNTINLQYQKERRDWINSTIDRLKAKETKTVLGYSNSQNEAFSHASILDERINGVKADKPKTLTNNAQKLLEEFIDLKSNIPLEEFKVLPLKEMKRVINDIKEC